MNSSNTSAELLKVVEKMPAAEFKRFLAGIHALRARRDGHSLPADEATLMKQINKGFSDSWWGHYHTLVEKRRDESLSRSEHRELLRLTQEVEKQEAKRVQALLKLADIRKTSLSALMKGLGLPSHSNA